MSPIDPLPSLHSLTPHPLPFRLSATVHSLALINKEIISKCIINTLANNQWKLINCNYAGCWIYRAFNMFAISLSRDVLIIRTQLGWFAVRDPANFDYLLANYESKLKPWNIKLKFKENKLQDHFINLFWGPQMPQNIPIFQILVNKLFYCII